MTSAPSAPESRSRVSQLIWLVPLTALIVSGWLLHRQSRDRGPVITVEFTDGAGIQAGKTSLVHKGVVVGLVQEVALSPRLDGVVVKLELAASAAPLAVEGSEFWLVHPEIGIGGVRGLDTLLSGARLEVRAGTGEPARRFQARAKAPVDDGKVIGRSFVLRSDKLGSLHAGTAVYYREIKVGLVDSHRLAPDATHVLITVSLFSPYHKLVRPETKFWNSGGISMKIGLTGAQVHSNSLESLVMGGISFATPEHHTGYTPPSEWWKWAPRLELAAE
jgi:paraquat-inducible protein B